MTPCGLAATDQGHVRGIMEVMLLDRHWRLKGLDPLSTELQSVVGPPTGEAPDLRGFS